MSSDVDAPAGKAAADSRQAIQIICSVYRTVKYDDYGLGGVMHIAEQLSLPSPLHVHVPQAQLMPEAGLQQFLQQQHFELM